MFKKILCLAFLLSPQLVFSKIICVDIHAQTQQGGEGSCWKNPYLDLETALAEAKKNKEIQEIWIAEGIYRPSKTYCPEDEKGNPVLAGAISRAEYNPGVDVSGKFIHYAERQNEIHQRLKTFHLVDKVKLIGGFEGQNQKNGGESIPNQRDHDKSKHQTILEGEGEVWHILTAGNDITKTGITTTLNRLVIRSGNACAAPFFPAHFPLSQKEVPIYYHDDGAGLYIFAKSNITLVDMVFAENKAVSGGAIYVQDGSMLTIQDSAFIKNSAYNGGAISARSGGPNETTEHSRVTKLNIVNSQFVENEAMLGSGRGAVIMTEDIKVNPPKGVEGVELTMTNNTLERNRSFRNIIYATGGKQTLNNNRYINNANSNQSQNQQQIK